MNTWLKKGFWWLDVECMALFILHEFLTIPSVYFYQSFIQLLPIQCNTKQKAILCITTKGFYKTVSWVIYIHASGRGTSDNCGNFPEVFVIVCISSPKRPRRNTLIKILCLVQICGQISKVKGFESGIQTIWVLHARKFRRFTVLLAVFNHCYMVHSLSTMTFIPTKKHKKLNRNFQCVLSNQKSDMAQKLHQLTI
jgi:hypothetical protein